MAVELYDEHEQSERVRGWLRENGVSIVMGVVLALGGIFGWHQWQDYQVRQSTLANEYYAAVQDELDAGQLDAAQQQYATMREAVGEHAYVALAGMLLAATHAEQGESEAARDIYRDLLAVDEWPALRPMLRLRLAAAETAAGDAAAALRLLEEDPPAGFEALWVELRGDVLFDLGRHAEAAEAYEQAVERLAGEGNSTRLAEAKLDHVRSLAGAAGSS